MQVVLVKVHVGLFLSKSVADEEVKTWICNLQPYVVQQFFPGAACLFHKSLELYFCVGRTEKTSANTRRVRVVSWDTPCHAYKCTCNYYPSS